MYMSMHMRKIRGVVPTLVCVRATPNAFPITAPGARTVLCGCAEVWMTILESGWNLWVWLVGVASRRWVWLVVRRFIHILTMIINFPYSTCISSFFGSSIPTSLFIFKCFFGLQLLYTHVWIVHVTLIDL